MTNASVQQSASLTGSPFNLRYNSENFKADSSLSPKNYKLGGWLPDLVQSYNTQDQILYSGDGSLRYVESAPLPNGGFYTTNKSGSEIFEFDNFAPAPIKPKTSEMQ